MDFLLLDFWFYWHSFRSFLFLGKVSLSVLRSYFFFSFLSFLFCFFCCLVYCLSHQLQGGYTIATPLGGITVILLQAQGIFLPPVGVFFSLLFVWFITSYPKDESFGRALFDLLFGVLIYSVALALSPYIYLVFPFLLFLCFATFDYFISIFNLQFGVSSSFLFLSFRVYRGSLRIYVVPVIAQHNGMALQLYYRRLQRSCLCRSFVTTELSSL